MILLKLDFELWAQNFQAWELNPHDYISSLLPWLSAKLGAWCRESSNYWTDALNEVCAGFPAGESSCALGQCDSSGLGCCVTSHPPPCCHSSCNQPPEHFPQEERKHHLSPLTGGARCLVSCCCCCPVLHLISVDLVPFPPLPTHFLTVMQHGEACQIVYYWERGEDMLLDRTI